jgi:hypothetical protein
MNDTRKFAFLLAYGAAPVSGTFLAVCDIADEHMTVACCMRQ